MVSSSGDDEQSDVQIEITALLSASPRKTRRRCGVSASPLFCSEVERHYKLLLGARAEGPTHAGHSRSDLIVDHLKAGDKLRLTGLGIHEVKDRLACAGRNPVTNVQQPQPKAGNPV